MARKLQRTDSPQLSQTEREPSPYYRYETRDATLFVAARGGQVTKWLFDVPEKKYSSMPVFSQLDTGTLDLRRAQNLTKVLDTKSQEAMRLPQGLDFRPVKDRSIRDSLLLTAKLGELSFRREFELRKGLLNIFSESPVVAPISERVCLNAHSTANRGPIMLNGETINGALNDATAEQAIHKGEPRLWKEFEGAAKVRLPNGNDIYVESSLNGRPVQHAILWRPTSGILCLEPIAGITPEQESSLQPPQIGRMVLATTVQIASR